MPAWRQVVTGFFMAILFSVILLGSISLSMAESGFSIAQAPTLTPTIPWASGSTLTPGIVLPSRPGLTRSPTMASITVTPTSTFLPPAHCPPPQGWYPILVLPGDSLPILAARYKISLQDLSAGNCLLTGTLVLGSVLYVPPAPTATYPPTPPFTPIPIYCPPAPVGWVPYTVNYGETLSALSLRYGVSIAQLMTVNCLPNSYIYAGQLLYVPYRPPTGPSITPTIFWGTLTPPLPPTQTPPSPPYYTSTPTHTPTIIFPPTWVFTPTPTATSTSTPTPTSTSTSTQTPTQTNTPLAPLPYP